MSYLTGDRKLSMSRLIGRIAIPVLLLVGGLPATAGAVVQPAPHWEIHASSVPTYFKPGDPADEYVISARNSGDGGTTGTITVTDALPEGVTATGVTGEVGTFFAKQMACSVGKTVSCSLNEGALGGELVRVNISVAVSEGLPETSITNTATISGGGAASASATLQTQISAAPVPFGLSYFASEATDPAGNAETQAGSHPFEFTTSFLLNTKSQVGAGSNPSPKDLEVELPPGILGNPLAVPRCTQTEFQTGSGYHGCPPDTAVGTLILYFYGEGKQEETVFNIEPPPGQPAELGFNYAGIVHIPMFFHVRSEGDYGITAIVPNINETNVVQGATLTLWGVPADTSHDRERHGSGECNESGCRSGAPPKAFLTLPTSCQNQALTTNIVADSWQNPGAFSAPMFSSLPGMTGCERLSFDPTLTMQADNPQANAPSGYSVDLKVPQNEDPAGLATPNVKNVTVVLPAGTAVSPSAANGLVGCPESGSEGINLAPSSAPARCPAASKVGSVEVTTPVLEHPLQGSVYLAQQGNAGSSQGANPFGSLMALYIVAEGSGVVVKLAGKVSANPVTGQITATFDENPQLPFSDFRLHFFGGPGAALVNPASCGSYTTTSQLTPWSASTPATRSSTFSIATACGGGGFAPSFTAGTLSNQAASYSPFSLTFGRQDGEGELSSIGAVLPPGVLGKLAGVQRCSDVEIAEQSCPAGSRIGSVTVAAGPGPNPVIVKGEVFFTGPYAAGPFGEVTIVPAIAGPFNLGNVVVRGSIRVDQHTAQVSVVSDPFPTILQGIPLKIKSVAVDLDREGFMFNPTSCAEEATTGAIASTNGVDAPVSSRFEAANCATLPFKPSFSASTGAKASKANGASLHVKLDMPAGQANVGMAKFDLPIQLPSRLATLQKACPDSLFEANPATCPAPSIVGTVLVHTPVLSSPLSGPIYIVSHGGAAFPDLMFVLQGEGVTLLLDGNTDIKKGVTSETFKSLPDAPISSFEAKFPTGPYSVLAAYLPKKANFSFCGAKLTMPAKLTGQNGAVFTQATKISASGCPKSAKAAHAGKVKRARRARVRRGK